MNIPKIINIERYGVKYQTGSKCPACSVERDQGGRLKLESRKYYYLRCDRCKYAVKSTGSYEKKHKKARDRYFKL